MSELQGRIALVTGASRGIGEAAARALAAAGAKVIFTDVADTSSLAAELGGLGRRQDVTSEADWVETIAFARTQAGGLDILVKMKPVTETSPEEWRRLYPVNVEGVPGVQARRPAARRARVGLAGRCVDRQPFFGRGPGRRGAGELLP